MPQQKQKAEVNNFVKGLITEASPLTFPENASLDEDNFVLNRDGTRQRRLGMDLEDGYETVTSSTSLGNEEIALSAFSWENAGGVASKTLSVVQTGAQISIFDGGSTPLSDGLLYQKRISGASNAQVFSYTSVDGTLIVASGVKEFSIFDYENGNITEERDYIKIRDQFGVEDIFEGVDLTEGTGLTKRPRTLTDPHRYNLRNQTWALPRAQGGEDRGLRDPLNSWSAELTNNNWPSNSDNVNYALYANANDSSNRTGDQFYAEDLFDNPPGTFLAPQGFFVIDAMERGKSRLEEVANLYDNYEELKYNIGSLPTDKTPGGPSVVGEYAGRVWFGGFEGEVIDGDSRSPRLSSYIFYSQLVENKKNITACYQEGDPTTKEAPDLVDTDGGFIRVDGAYGIKKLINVGKGLLVIASNGIWMITGGSDYGFSATNNMRQKITDRGCDSNGSAVVVENTVMFWADDAIYHVAPNQYGDYEAKNITQTTIQKFYDGITTLDKAYAQGFYDSYDRKVRWVYNNRLSSTDNSRELIFDLTLGAFYTSTISSLGSSYLPKVVAPVKVSPFRLTEVSQTVTDEGESVTDGGEDVATTVTLRGQGNKETAYLTILDTNPIRFSFSLYRDTGFVDWRSVDGEGADAEAYLLTGYMSGGDFMRRKEVPYITFHFKRTETGFISDETGNLFPVGESSCRVQYQWDWSDSANSNKWGRPFQAYRYRRLYSPANAADPFDNGFDVISTKNKLRGHGKVISLKIYTDPGKDCQLLGWSMLLGVNANV